MKTLLCLLILTVLHPLVAADPPGRCAACAGPVGAAYYTLNSPTLGEKQPVCESCSKIKERCVICYLPVPATSPRKLDGGRLFCERDFRAGVFDATDARRVFEETRREAAALLTSYGVLPDRNITVALVNGAEIKKLQQSLPSNHDGDTTLGLTRTESSNRRHFTHQIYLVNGLPRSRLAAVAAHEYTHAWMNENVPADRKLDKDTVEGFCELVAYKLMVQRRDEQQKRIILENAYTRGQINAFIEAEQQHNFHRIVKWVQTGEDEVLTQTNKGRVLALRTDDTPDEPLWPPR